MAFPLKWPEKQLEGIPRDLPQKTGLALYGDIVLREAWDLFKLNLLIIVFSVPIVTAPAAHVAAISVVARMVRDENTYLWRDFWSAFRHHFVRASLLGLLVLPVLGGAIYSNYIWSQVAWTTPVAVVPLVLALAVTLFALLVAINAFVVLATTDLDISPSLRRALAAALIKPSGLVYALAFVVALWAVHIVFYPISIFMPAVMNFSLGILALALASLHALDVLDDCVAEASSTHRQTKRSQPQKCGY